MNMQGMNMQGMNMQGMNMQGMELGTATVNGVGLQNLRVVHGEIVAMRGSTTLRGADLVGAQFRARVRNLHTSPPKNAVVKYRVAAVTAEDARYDPTHTGDTYLYTLEQWVPDTSSWRPACSPDSDGRNVAIPLAAIWDERGDQSQSDQLFTFGCTTGVIAKCYRWGYRPWASGYGDLVAMHQTCTRLARADYCGDGMPHTRDGTWVNVWDTLPRPIQSHGTPPLGWVFEAGWNTDGAVCLSRARWLLEDGVLIAQACPDKLVPPGLGETVCESVAQVLGYDANAKMFDEAFINVHLGL
jgi:hypothetical protein